MNNLSYLRSLILIILLFISCNEQNEKIKIAPPEELYGQLFYDVQSNENIFSDSKTFVDCIPLYDTEVIKEKYAGLTHKTDSSILEFVKSNFEIPEIKDSYKTDSSSINTHISKLWDVLKRDADEQRPGTLIPLPHPYIVPGGRFREVYYWDSYFTMLGLAEDNRIEMIENMIDNFSYLIDKYGYIPNGNRTYYLSRSQPPFYSLMVSLLAEIKGESIYVKYLPFLEKEYNFWMKGKDLLNDSVASYKHIVRMPGGEILNRYYDEKNVPRSESFREDLKTAVETDSTINKENVYRDLRSAAESGWDFSSRWLTADSNGEYNLTSIQTTQIIPLDLNSLIGNLELTLSKACKISGDRERSESYKLKFEKRKSALIKYCWDSKAGFFTDYNFILHRKTDKLTLAGTFPLFFKLADKNQAERVSEIIETKFLKPGGVVTTLNNTGQQWDAPNGWAPLQYITIIGLRNYGLKTLAESIKNRWLNLNKKVYKTTFKMFEKYDVVDTTRESGGGEYPTQDGFGWTNGVFQKLSGEL